MTGHDGLVAAAGIVALGECAGLGPEVVGGKAYALGQMVRAGLPVPAGFVVPVDACGDDAALAHGIVAAFDALGVGEVAVRSSATVEDGSANSWAGQFETTLGVTRERVVDAVRACRESAGAARVGEYAAARAVTPTAIRMAVVIQAMVPAEAAGVAMTGGVAQPGHISVEAVAGLGEGLVSGVMTPERIEVRGDGTRVVTGGGSTELGVFSRAGGGAIVGDAVVDELVALCRRVESLFGGPQDIEWAVSGGVVQLLQARPVTASLEGSRPYAGWGEVPLFRWGPTAGRYFFISDYVAAACEMELVAKGLVFPRTVLTFSGDHMVWICPLEDMEEFAEQVLVTVCGDGAHMAGLRVRYDDALDALDACSETAWDSLGVEEFAGQVRGFYAAMREFWLSTLPAEIGNYGAERALRARLVGDGVADGDLDEVVAALVAPRELSATQREEVELSRAVGPGALAAHARRYRYIQSSYYGPVACEVAEFARRRQELGAEVGAGHLARLAEAGRRRDETVRRHRLSDATVRLGELVAANAHWQDERKFRSLAAFAVKEAIRARLSREHGLGDGLSYSLSADEAVALAGGDTGAAGAAYEGRGVLFPGPLEYLPPLEAVSVWAMYGRERVGGGEGDAALSGTVACKGSTPVVTGTARVVVNPAAEVVFEPGDVLVAPWTSPDYIFLMRRASALVTDEGGLLCHAAIESRELGLACIVGTKTATALIADGDEVTVDCERNQVSVSRRAGRRPTADS